MAERDSPAGKGPANDPGQHAGDRAGRRRSYPRIELGQPASVRLKGGELADDAVHDVSRGGLQLRCDREFAGLLHPTGDVIKEGSWPKVALAIRFPYPEGLPRIVVGCTLRYVRGIEGGRFAFGVKFERFKSGHEDHFQRFIEESLRPIAPDG